MNIEKRWGWLQASRHIAGLALAAGLVPGAAHATTTLSLDPAAQNVTVGGTFDLALNISGLGENIAPSLSAFDLDVLFDTSLAQFDSFTFGTGLGILALQGAGNIAGGANVFAVSLEGPSILDGGQPADFTLGTLHFTSLGVGNAAFSLSITELGDSLGAPLDPAPSLHGANVNITGTQPVPEGGPGWMAAMGLGALALAQRKMREQRAIH